MNLRQLETRKAPHSEDWSGGLIRYEVVWTDLRFRLR